ncbi:CBO0543 family protein [Paenibacillus sp.]|uniref:CBO0543 family protein n=1 Tax=Paenibacillus sp. TaxID=58172 RepID=UPI0028110064|nr:CBO0543 family protein [Paenibacillus sp.]
MSDEQRKALKKITDEMATTKDHWFEYWKTYSDFDTWQFWANVFLFVAPLIVLFIFLDRNKAFRIGFFGFGVHMISVYLDAFGTTHGFWEYPFKWFPFLTNSLGLDASLIPVAYMLLYQWTLNREKNYYLYMTGLSLMFSFGFKPLMDWLELFQRNKGLQFWHLFIIYLLVGIVPKLLTDFFAWYQSKAHVRRSRA